MRCHFMTISFLYSFQSGGSQTSDEGSLPSGLNNGNWYTNQTVVARPNKNILLLIASTSQTSQSGKVGEMTGPPFHFYCSVAKCGLAVGLVLQQIGCFDLAMDFVYKQIYVTCKSMDLALCAAK